MNADEITLTRIVALIRKLEEKHPEAHNMIQIKMYDDMSGCFEYNKYYPDEGVGFVDDFSSMIQLSDLMKKYGV